MSLRFREYLEDEDVVVLNLDHQRSLVDQCHKRQFWKEDVNEETGEPFLNEDGTVRMIPVDEITTTQSFKDSADINKILDRHQIKNVQAHLVEFPPEAYQVFQDIDLLEAHAQIDRANEIFAALPSEVRNEFGQDAFRFVKFAADPANNARLAELFPAIAAPGAYFPNPAQRGGQGAGAATAPDQSRIVQDDPAAASSTPEGSSEPDPSSPT